MEDAALWTAFIERTLGDAAWTHEAHLRVAWMHLERWELDEAHLRMRVGIIKLNAVHGLEETPQRGYHETLTRVWLVLVDTARAVDKGNESRAFLRAHAALLDREAPLRFYSRPRLYSVAARSHFVAPDLAPLTHR